MNPMIYYILIGAVLLFAFYMFFFRSKKSGKTEAETDAVDISEDQDFEKDFFARTQSGEKSQLFMTVATAGESTMIRSLLFADGIPSHSEGEHMNNIYGGITGSMAAVVAVRIYILCSDYERAVDIVKKFDLKKGNIILQPQG